MRIKGPVLYTRTINTLMSGADTGAGEKGAMALRPDKGCPIKSHKSATGRAHFTEKMPQLGHMLWRKCPIWGTFYEGSAPVGAHIAEEVPRVGQILWKMCPMSRNSYSLFAPHFLLAPPLQNCVSAPVCGEIILVKDLYLGGQFLTQYHYILHKFKYRLLYIQQGPGEFT